MSTFAASSERVSSGSMARCRVRNDCRVRNADRLCGERIADVFRQEKNRILGPRYVFTLGQRMIAYLVACLAHPTIVPERYESAFRGIAALGSIHSIKRPKRSAN
jgi:hypothetical protein